MVDKSVEENNTHISMSIKELETLEKKSRHIIYGYKKELSDVLRYNSMGVILPVYVEKELRSILKDIRDNDIDTNKIYIKNEEYDYILEGTKNNKGRNFLLNGKPLNSIKSSGDTYKHIGNQGIEIYKGAKESMKNGDIDKKQYINDIIRDEWHDVGEYITDDIPRFEKSDDFRKWEKNVEHEIISNQEGLTDKEKKYLMNILNYSPNSRFKIYEHLLFIGDAIEMKNNADKYNETLSVIYEILKWNISKLLENVELDNGDIRPILSLKGIFNFIKEREKQIDELFEYLKDNTDKLQQEYRFIENGYDINNFGNGFSNFKNDRRKIKRKLGK